MGSRLYSSGQPCGNGHTSPRYASNGCCQECQRNRAKMVTETNPEYHQRYWRENIDRFKEYRTANRGARRGYVATARANRRKRAVPWGSKDDIKAFYQECPDGFHVDHILPMQAKEVCGLHVLSNLQYLPAKDNMLKQNKVDPVALEANVCPIKFDRLPSDGG